ncbi:Peptidase family M48 [Paenibacillus tianmuensis]|uniref:Peptidase family M48 n=1 Tax=Paenibacillus tianmuensis TaxID=624147 RepID=A0A1G4TFZ4_9BACL|nr:M56 family metallopeptidase [Paenibacillus tianmuensis]SCW79529.1 Peptidase family M48 [Paenibacillus tianmuensis]
MWEKRSRILFLTGLGFSGLIMSQIVAYALHLLLGLEIKHNLIQFCASTASIYGLDGVEYAFDIVVFYTLLLTVGLIVQQQWASWCTYRRLQSKRDERMTAELNGQYGGGGEPILVVACDEPRAFTMNLLNPKVILSTGLIRLLDARELEAVIHHEMYHWKHGDPLKTFVLSLCSSVMGYVPLLRWVHQKYRTVREVLADHYAIEQLGSSIEIGSALLKLLKYRKSETMVFSYVSFADNSINCRIQLILDPQSEIPFKLPLKLILISFHTVLLLGAMFFFATL